MKNFLHRFRRRDRSWMLGIQQINIVNLRFSCTMILLCILASMTLIGITNSAPLSSYTSRGLSTGHPNILLLMDQRIPDLEGEMLNSDDDLPVVRTKRLGALSIVDNVDVLRQRVMLELARRKADKLQKQIDINRNMMDTIGKRSVPEYGSDSGRFIGFSSVNHGYGSQQHSKYRERSGVPNKIAERTQVWFEENNPLFHDNQDDQTIRANELRLL